MGSNFIKELISFSIIAQLFQQSFVPFASGACVSSRSLYNGCSVPEISFVKMTCGLSTNEEKS